MRRAATTAAADRARVRSRKLRRSRITAFLLTVPATGRIAKACERVRERDRRLSGGKAMRIQILGHDCTAALLDALGTTAIFECKQSRADASRIAASRCR